MQRRGVTVLVGAVLVALLIAGIWTAPVPYVALVPGVTVDTLGSSNGNPVIEVNGADSSKSAGQLRLVTVSVMSELRLLDAIRGWFNGDEAVVPRELIYPPNQTEEQVDQRNADDFKASQSSAETAALRKLGHPVHVLVKEVSQGAPAQGKLAAGDELTSVGGQPVTSVLKLQELIQAKPVGTALDVQYLRGGRPGTASITTGAGREGKAVVGITAENSQPHPFTLKIQLDRIGGPSAGLMFALGIIDRVDPADLTGGKIIAGTGSIDDEGLVGPIGGVPQKLVSAKNAKAVAFLTPADNCAEALRNAQPGVKLVKVSTLDDALSALAAIREGREATPCTAN